METVVTLSTREVSSGSPPPDEPGHPTTDVGDQTGHVVVKPVTRVGAMRDR